MYFLMILVIDAKDAYSESIQKLTGNHRMNITCEHTLYNVKNNFSKKNPYHLECCVHIIYYYYYFLQRFGN